MPPVVVRQDAAGAVQVEIMDPNAMLELVDQPQVGEIAAEVRERLQRVLVAV
jgi:hypothetical protein